MAAAAVQTAMNLEEKKTVHPFFSKPSKHNPTEQPRPSNENHDNSDHDREAEQRDAAAPKKRARKSDGSKIKRDSGVREKSQSSLTAFAMRTGGQERRESMQSEDQASYKELSIQDDDSQHRRKRRKTLSPGPSNDSTASTEDRPKQPQGHPEVKSPILAECDPPPYLMLNDVPMVDVTESPRAHMDEGSSASPTTPPPTNTLDASIEAPDKTDRSGELEGKPGKQTLKKQIKVSKSGKLLSSPPRSDPNPSTSPKKKRGRRSLKPKIQATATVIKYGSDAESRRVIGQKIEAILNSKKSPRGRSSTPKPKKTARKPVGPPKATHPFFLGNPDQNKEEAPDKPANNLPPTPKKSAVTPGKLRAERQRDQSPDPTPAFGPVLGGSRAPKQSGLNEASWPSRETAHVRNLDQINPFAGSQRIESSELRPKKMKNNVVNLSSEEDLIARLSRDLTAHINMYTDPSKSDFAPPEDVRLPTRLLTTGVELQKKIRSRLRAPPYSIEQQHATDASTHAAVICLFNDIEHILTPFDQGKCEIQSWTQKYAPQSASHVLQPGKEAIILRDWLKSLTVMSVEGQTDPTRASNQADGKRPTKKRRKVEDDGFIVFGDEEAENEMTELPDSEAYGPYVEWPDRLRSLTRSRLSRDKNVVLISGPHGCGKSATVYAVAKELGFEVFEINSSSRRSGKDIQDKVGDMTEYHLVNHKRSESATQRDTVPADDTDNERMSKALQKDIDSGRQGTMTSFFKTNSAPKSKPEMNPKTQKALDVRTQSGQTTLPLAQAHRKSQKQSLILFEEADILFEEDQSFWTQVTKLASQSKRPIIITCNDELQIPTHDLPLAAVLRLSPPPVELATDYLLTLVGREGHILQREALCQLYKAKNYDLRASITELNLWCQMSVGDRKGGLEWIYQRWPPGQDVDEKGQLLRVASEGTYLPGMGWFSHNILESGSNVGFDAEEELLKEAWDGWGVAPSNWNSSYQRVAHSTGAWSSNTENLKNLEALDAFSEAVSAADTYCRVGFPSYENDWNEPTDPSLPPIPGKARLNFTIAAAPIQVDVRSDFLGLDTSIFTQTHLLIRRAFPGLWSARSDTEGYVCQSEKKCVNALLRYQDENRKRTLTRSDFSFALDVLALSPSMIPSLNSSYNLIPSSFDRAFAIVTMDLAPYVRSIVSHEIAREAERIRISNLLSEGGRAKKPRTTRASRVAMEGGQRETIRRERWFDSDLCFQDVMQTAGKSWAGLGSEVLSEGSTESFAGPQDSAQVTVAQ